MLVIIIIIIIIIVIIIIIIKIIIVNFKASPNARKPYFSSKAFFPFICIFIQNIVDL